MSPIRKTQCFPSLLGTPLCCVTVCKDGKRQSQGHIIEENSVLVDLTKLGVFLTRLHVHQRMNANGNWHQMIYFSETRLLMGIHYIHYVYLFVQCTTTLTLCITASWSPDEAVFCVLGHLAMSSLLHCPDPIAAHYPFLGDRGPLPPKWHPFPQDLRTLPFHGSEQGAVILKILNFKESSLEI
jgi:hypothetical protein